MQPITCSCINSLALHLRVLRLIIMSLGVFINRRENSEGAPMDRLNIPKDLIPVHEPQKA